MHLLYFSYCHFNVFLMSFLIVRCPALIVLELWYYRIENDSFLFTFLIVQENPNQYFPSRPRGLAWLQDSHHADLGWLSKKIVIWRCEIVMKSDTDMYGIDGWPEMTFSLQEICLRPLALATWGDFMARQIEYTHWRETAFG